MVMHHGSTEVGYNVQTVVDEQHQLIVEHQVTNDPTDHAHLAEMALRAKEFLGVEQLEVVADMGYYDGAEVKAMRRSRHYDLHSQTAHLSESEARLVHQTGFCLRPSDRLLSLSAGRRVDSC